MLCYGVNMPIDGKQILGYGLVIMFILNSISKDTMGLFGKLLGREGAQKNEAAEAPKAEAAEVKSAKETGKERVDKMLEASRAAKNATMARTGSVLARVGGAMRDAFFASIGGVEKGGKEAAKYAGETKTEAGELVGKGIDAGNKLDSDVASFLKDAAVAGVDALNKLGDWGSGAMKELSEKAPGVHADIQSRVETGAKDVGDNLVATVMEGIKQFNAFKDWVGAAKKEFAQKRGEVHQDILDKASARIEPYALAAGKFAENVINVPRDTRKEFDILSAKAGAAKDRFVGSANEARLSLAGTAELKGEVEALREQVARLTRMVEAHTQLSNVVPETKADVRGEPIDQEVETLKASEEETVIVRGEDEEFDAEEETEKKVQA